MITVRAYVRPDNTTTIICPSCNKAQQFQAESFRHKTHTLKVRCKCKTPFMVQLDFRVHYRKQTNLPGIYQIIKPPGAGGGIIQVQNLSQTGIGFTVSGQHPMAKGQIVQLEFHIEDKNKSKLILKARICTVNNNYIGCVFTDTALYSKKLGFYLRP